MNNDKVRCGDCRYFVRDGKCGFLASDAGRKPGRAFEYAPFWVWSDCFSDREQVRANVETMCATFEPCVRDAGEAGDAKAAPPPQGRQLGPTGNAPNLVQPS